MFDISSLKNNTEAIRQQLEGVQNNFISGVPLGDFIFNRIVTRLDPIEYCERVLRSHLPPAKQMLHENQIELIRAVCNPKIRKVSALMARQCIAEGSVIHTRDGELVRIEEHPNAWKTNDNADIYEVKLQGGYSVKCTSNHPIMTIDGWKEAGTLTTKDTVLVLESWNKFGEGTGSFGKEGYKIDDKLAELLGLIILQIPTCSDNLIVCKNDKIVQRVKRLFEECVTKEDLHVVKNAIISDEYIEDFIKELQLDISGFPKVINKFNQQQVIKFIGGLFRTNGKIYRSNNKVKVNLHFGDNLIFGDFCSELLNKLGIRGAIKDGKITISSPRGLRVFKELIADELDEQFPLVDLPKTSDFYTTKGEDGEVLTLAKVSSIKKNGTATVWDVEYPNKGWFICGGMKVHNSGKTESIASFTGFLLDNYPNMRIGIFTPRIQQAEVNVGRTSVFFQMNEEKLNNKLVKCTKQKIELSNKSYVMAVSGSDQSNIEGLTFDIIILDEAQKITNYTWSERIAPMGGATNAKMIKIGTPKTRNHFYDSMEGQASKEWFTIRRDWTRCPQLWALDATELPDHENPNGSKLRPYSTYVLSLMPKALKQLYFPNNPEVWKEGEMSVEDFKTQYMLEFIDGAGQFFGTDEWDKLCAGDFYWQEHGKIGERFVAGIDFASSGTSNADYTHISVVRITPNQQKQKVFAMEMHGVSYPDQMRTIAQLLGGPNPRFQCQSIFADYTGCGRPVVDTLVQEFGMTNLTGITFNASDTYTNSGMNMKNIMFAQFRNEVSYDRFKYPKEDNFMQSAGADKKGFYHKMVGEWRDLEMESRLGVNKIINAPTGGHDDCCCADVLANFAALYGAKRQMPRPSSARIYSR